MMLQHVNLEQMSAIKVLVLRTSWPTILSIKTDVIFGGSWIAVSSSPVHLLLL